MIRRNLYAFFTGLYFAVLQFNFFLVLQINISSTYITYMTVVISWMVGAVLGLWLKGLRTLLGVTTGLLSYYGVYLLIAYDPLSRSTLLLAALGVCLTGLWAGRFFTVMLPVFKQTDALFFHENNGFLVGVVTVFIGFTSFGRLFLAWAPLVCGAALLVGPGSFSKTAGHGPQPSTVEPVFDIALSAAEMSGKKPRAHDDTL